MLNQRAEDPAGWTGRPLASEVKEKVTVRRKPKSMPPRRTRYFLQLFERDASLRLRSSFSGSDGRPLKFSTASREPEGFPAPHFLALEAVKIRPARHHHSVLLPKERAAFISDFCEKDGRPRFLRRPSFLRVFGDGSIAQEPGMGKNGNASVFSNFWRTREAPRNLAGHITGLIWGKINSSPLKLGT